MVYSHIKKCHLQAVVIFHHMKDRGEEETKEKQSCPFCSIIMHFQFTEKKSHIFYASGNLMLFFVFDGHFNKGL